MGIVAFIVGILALIGFFVRVAPVPLGILGVVLAIIGMATGSYVGLSVIGLILSLAAIGLAYFGVAGTRPTVGRGA